MVIICTKSGNENWTEKCYRKAELSSGQIRVIDNTGLPFGKRIVVFLKNVDIDFGESYQIWQDLFVSPSHNAYFTFSGTNTVLVSGSGLYPKNMTVGRKYGFDDNGVVTDVGAASSGSSYDVRNDSSVSKTVAVKRNGKTLVQVTVEVDGTKTFTLRPTFWIGVIGFGAGDFNVSDINTEMSLLGVTTADVSVTGTPGSYSFSLTNIT